MKSRTGMAGARTQSSSSLRLRAVSVLARRRLTDHILAPATWVLAAFGLALAFFVVRGFVKSVDTGGLDFSLHPPYEILYGILGSAFGVTYVRQLFADGPFALASFVACAPILLYLCLSSVQRFGSDRRSGMVDLVTAGPADASAYLFSFGVADALVVAVYLALTGLYLAASGAAWNLAVGMTVVMYLVGLMFFAASLLSLAFLLGAVLRQPASGVALFLVIAAVFAFSEVVSFAAVGGGPGSPAVAASWVLRWLSPFYYLDSARMAAGSGRVFPFFAAVLAQAVLCAAFLAGAHVVSRSREAG